MYRTDFWTLWEEARVGCSERTALKQVYYQGWNRSPAQVGCMRQVLGSGALGRPRGIGWSGRWEGGSGWGIHVNPWLIHVNVWQKPLQYCKVISLQLIKINEKKRKKKKDLCSEWRRCCDYGLCQKWFVKFHARDFSLANAPQLARWVEVDSDQIETLTENSLHYTVQEMADILKISKSSTENHLHQLGYVNCFDVWVPHKGKKKPSWPYFQMQFST